MDNYFVDNKVWPDGDTKLHIYIVVPHLDEKTRPFERLVAEYQQALQAYQFITPVTWEHLHATVQMIDKPARDVSPEQRAQLIRHLQEELCEVDPFELTVGPAIAGGSGVVLDMTPDRPFYNLRERVHAAIVPVLGQECLGYSSGRPHMSLGYACAQGDSGEVSSRMRRLTGERPVLPVAYVVLAEVRQNVEHHRFEWTALARISLGSSMIG